MTYDRYMYYCILCLVLFLWLLKAFPCIKEGIQNGDKSVDSRCARSSGSTPEQQPQYWIFSLRPFSNQRTLPRGMAFPLRSGPGLDHPGVSLHGSLINGLDFCCKFRIQPGRHVLRHNMRPYRATQHAQQCCPAKQLPHPLGFVPKAPV